MTKCLPFHTFRAEKRKTWLLNTFTFLENMGKHHYFLTWQIKSCHMNLPWLAQTTVSILCSPFPCVELSPGVCYPVPPCILLHVKISGQWNVNKSRIDHLRARALKNRWLKRWILWYMNCISIRMGGRKEGKMKGRKERRKRLREGGDKD